MPNLIASPTAIDSVGNKTKFCDEFVGLVNTGERKVSVTVVRSPAGWEGVAQWADYDEYRIVIKGVLRVEHAGGSLDVGAAQALHVKRGEEVRFSTPGEDGAEYINVCVPAFSAATVHRGK
jgi:mannose-6-phosphate isomerase-like protein (cupin superfamily)